MRLVYPGYDEKSKTAAFVWPTVGNMFAVFKANGDPIVSATYHAGEHRVMVGGVTRIIPANDVIPTVRLYLNAQRLRKKLKTAETMVIW